MSVYVLDTDIFTLYRRGHGAVMRHAFTHTPEELVITVSTVEEQLFGWYVLLRRAGTSVDLTRDRYHGSAHCCHCPRIWRYPRHAQRARLPTHPWPGW